MKDLKNKLFLAGFVSIALTGCTSNEYFGDDPAAAQNGNGAIQFSSKAGMFTRATSNTGSVAEMLDGQMQIFGVKKKNAVTDPASPEVYTTVFNNYKLWSNSKQTTSNPDGDWEYVGVAGNYESYTTSTSTVTNTVTLTTAQNIKYWDWATDEYHFVAVSPVSSISDTGYGYTITTSGEIDYVTVKDINGHINPNTGTALSKNPVYIAAPVKKPKADYGTEVEFSFTRQQSFVRVGVYETIPGYKISSISFYEWDLNKSGGAGWKADAQTGHNIVLNSMTANYFQGGAAIAKVKYSWDTPSSTFEYTNSDIKKENWYGGALVLSATNPLATSSTEATKTYFYGTDNDIDNNGYFTVLPTPSGTTAQPIIIKCDYELTSLDGAETINVKGATAAIPSAFCKWNPNTSYTYLFKISDNTDGKTDPDQPKEGLYPITFDATVITEASGSEQGTITSVATPSITTYQEGSVTDAGIKYTFNSTSTKPIYFTAQNNETGSVIPLSNSTAAVGKVLVYKVADLTATTAPTEADLQITPPSTGAITPNLVSAAIPVGNWTIPTGAAYFTPEATGYYAIQYVTAISSDPTPAPTAYAYKIIKVEAVSGS